MCLALPVYRSVQMLLPMVARGTSGLPLLQGPKACMGPGTGLGQANLYWSENFGDYRVWPSEGAHASFAPRGWKQRALQTHVERQLGYCEVEHVCPASQMPFALILCCISAKPVWGCVCEAGILTAW